MIQSLEILTVLLVVLATVPALAHALELPGKRRLAKDAYLAMQPIYYPGFTMAGFGEVVAIPATLALLLLTPAGGTAFWLILAALIALLAMHAVYWVFTHPVNGFWLENYELKGFGARFFAADPLRRSREAGGAEKPDWTWLRDRWESSHVVRAVLAVAGLIALLIAVTL